MVTSAPYMHLCFAQHKNKHTAQNCLTLSCFYLKADTAHREIAPILEHAQVLCHQRCSMDQAHGCFCVALPLGVLLCHVLQPRQPQVWWRLVSFCNSKNRGQKAGGNDHISNNKNIFIILPLSWMEEDISVFILYDSLKRQQKKWLGSAGQ